MKDLWKHHFKYYNFFQMNRSSYLGTLKFILEHVKGKRIVLDSGAGSGNLVFELLKKGHKVVAVDFHKYALKILKEKCKKYGPNLIIMERDVQQMGFRPESFDAVTSMFVIPFVKENKKYFREVYRALRKKGRFVIAAWSPVKDTWKDLMEGFVKELNKKGLLPKYKKEWDHIVKSSRVNLGNVRKGPNLFELFSLLKEVGFRKVNNYPSPYGKYCYLIVCEK